MNLNISKAAELIRSGKLVAFPTETVYGLGANALNAKAVQAIFKVKGRPATSPLIVHVDSVAMAQSLVMHWPTSATLLCTAFWPGPLTLVLPKKSIVPDIVTAGLPSVGIRMPNHPIALALIEAAKYPIAAPSANRFTELSPTTALHVQEALGTQIDFILDGGPTQVGIESTVLSLMENRPQLLRPGMITQAQMEAIIGPIDVSTHVDEGAHLSPGQHLQHYQPKTPLYLVQKEFQLRLGRGIYLGLTGKQNGCDYYEMPKEPRMYAQKLYALLHDVDQQHYDWIAVECPSQSPEWTGILDRLTRASYI